MKEPDGKEVAILSLHDSDWQFRKNILTGERRGEKENGMKKQQLDIEEGGKD